VRSPAFTAPCGHRMSHKDHGFVGSDGVRLYDSLKCLDVAEGRTPQKPDKDEKPDNGGKTWEGRGR
jgi:hypothetical protein